jgi:hypothetical protein
MSISSYFFVSDSEQAKNSEDQPNVEGGNLRTFYGVMNTSVESLFQVMNGGKSISLCDVSQSEDYTSFTFSFPDEILTTLCGIESSNKNAIVQNWMKVEDCPYDNKQDLSDLLDALIELANNARSSKQELLFRMEM